jgi:hypothetical protein
LAIGTIVTNTAQVSWNSPAQTANASDPLMSALYRATQA